MLCNGKTLAFQANDRSSILLTRSNLMHKYNMNNNIVQFPQKSDEEKQLEKLNKQFEEIESQSTAIEEQRKRIKELEDKK